MKIHSECDTQQFVYIKDKIVSDNNAFKLELINKIIIWIVCYPPKEISHLNEALFSFLIEWPLIEYSWSCEWIFLYWIQCELKIESNCNCNCYPNMDLLFPRKIVQSNQIWGSFITFSGKIPQQIWMLKFPHFRRRLGNRILKKCKTAFGRLSAETSSLTTPLLFVHLYTFLEKPELLIGLSKWILTHS